MTDEDMMVAIPVEEYEHLKECKARLMEIHRQKISEINNKIMQMQMKEVNMLSFMFQEQDYYE